MAKITCPYCGQTFPNIDTLYAHIASVHPEAGTPTPTAPATPAGIGDAQAYLNWLYNRLKTGDEYGDPDASRTWMGLAGPSPAYQMLVSAMGALEQGAWGTQAMLQLPFMPDYLKMMGQFQKIFPEPEAPEAPEVPPTYTPEELERLEAQTELDRARAQEILWEMEQSGQMTPSQQAELDYLYKKLEFEMQQAGIGDELGWAELDLARQRLAQEVGLSQQQLAQEAGLAQQQFGLQRNEWLAGLQAQPANWIERWFAERQPWGGERIPLESDKWLTPTGAPTGAGWQPPAGTTAGAGWQPPTEGAIGFPGTFGQGGAGGVQFGGTPGGMTPEQAQSLYTPGQLETGLIGAGEVDPVRRYMIGNIGDMSDEEIAFWGIYPDAKGLAAQKAKAEEISARLGFSLGAGEMRDYARYVKKQHDMAEAMERNLYPQAQAAVTPSQTLEQEYGEYPWRSKLRHTRAVEEVAATPFEQWYQTTRVNPWETEADVRKRYERLSAEAAAPPPAVKPKVVKPKVEKLPPAMTPAEKQRWEKFR